MFDVEHSRLPVPLLAPVPWEQEDPREKATTDADPSERPDADVVGIALKEGAKETSPAAPRLLNPLERAKAIKARAIADAAAKAKAGKAAVAASASKAAEASKAIAALREAHLALAAARGKHDAATRALDKATAPEAVERAKDLLAAAESKVADAEKAADEARAVEAAKTPEAIAAAKAAWEAEKASSRGGCRPQGSRPRDATDLDLRQQEDSARLCPPGVGTDSRSTGGVQGPRNAHRNPRVCRGIAGGQRQGLALALGLAAAVCAGKRECTATAGQGAATAGCRTGSTNKLPAGNCCNCPRPLRAAGRHAEDSSRRGSGPAPR